MGFVGNFAILTLAVELFPVGIAHVGEEGVLHEGGNAVDSHSFIGICSVFPDRLTLLSAGSLRLELQEAVVGQ